MNPYHCYVCGTDTHLTTTVYTCSDKCEKEFLDLEHNKLILECLRRICEAASNAVEFEMAKTFLGSTCVPIDIKLINEGRKLLQLPELKPTSE